MLPTTNNEGDHTMTYGNEISIDAIRQQAPSVFAQQAWPGMSEKYQFIPTSAILEGLMKEGFKPVFAQQSVVRIQGQQEYAKHILRFRHGAAMSTDIKKALHNGEEVPEITIVNAHNGAGTYQLNAGFYRFACSNKMIVECKEFMTIRVKHIGHGLVDKVIEGAYKVIEDIPAIANQIKRWKSLELSSDQREAFAEEGAAIRGTALVIPPKELLTAYRSADKGTDLYSTLNVVQENLVRGGQQAKTRSGRRATVRGISSVNADIDANRGLWNLAAEMETLLAA